MKFNVTPNAATFTEDNTIKFVFDDTNATLPTLGNGFYDCWIDDSTNTIPAKLCDVTNT